MECSKTNAYVSELKHKEDELAIQYLPAVKAMAYRLKERLPSSIDFCDLAAIGTEELVKLARRYDESQNDSFWGYGKTRVHGAMLDYLRSLDVVSRSNRKLIKMIDKAIMEHLAEHENEPSNAELAELLGESEAKINDARIASEIYAVMPIDEQLSLSSESSTLDTIEKENLIEVIESVLEFFLSLLELFLGVDIHGPEQGHGNVSLKLLLTLDHQERVRPIFHIKGFYLVELQGIGIYFIRKRIARPPLSAAQGTAALDHEIFDHPMKNEPVVIGALCLFAGFGIFKFFVALGQPYKIIDCFGGLALEQSHLDIAEGCLNDVHRILLLFFFAGPSDTGRQHTQYRSEYNRRFSHCNKLPFLSYGPSYRFGNHNTHCMELLVQMFHEAPFPRPNPFDFGTSKGRRVSLGNLPVALTETRSIKNNKKNNLSPCTPLGIIKRLI